MKGRIRETSDKWMERLKMYFEAEIERRIVKWEYFVKGLKYRSSHGDQTRDTFMMRQYYTTVTHTY
jgi:hypothetical protein